MSITPTFTVRSGIGKSRNVTPTSSNNFSSRTSSKASLSASAQVQERNKQLLHMKEQFLALKQQFKEEQMKDNERIMILERQLRQEIKKTQELEDKLAELKSMNIGKNISGSARVVENIWNIMLSYRDQIRNGAIEKMKKDEQNATKKSISYAARTTKTNYDNDDDSDLEYSVLRKKVNFK